MSPELALATLSDAELRAELFRRERLASEANWQAIIARAKYLCPDCGGPDSWHTRDCPTDTD
jgi:hypothetical protein